MEITQQVPLLLAEVETSPTDMFCPREEMCNDHDKLIGVVDNEFLRKMYGCAQLHRREQKRTQLEISFEIDEQARTRLASTVLRERYMADWLMETFWFLLRLHTNYWEPTNIGLRAGWKFVAVSPEHEIADIVRRALGGE